MAKYALVIGIAQYEPSLRLLPKAAADAEAIALLLESHGYHVTRLPRKQTAPGEWVIDTTQKLTHETFSTELKTFLRDRATNQDAIIYFAGHGFRVTNPITDEAEGYLAVSNSATNGRNAIAISDLNTLIGKSTLSSLVMLFDCCYAGTLIEQKSLLKSTQSTISSKQNYCLIAACREFEQAREGKEHGIFTSAVLRGLSADNAVAGMITSAGLLEFVSRELQSSGQEPVHAGSGRVIPLVNYSSSEMAVGRIDETSPYQGLEPFTESTAHFFFGRKPVVESLLERLECSNFILLTGPSGGGKSSVVRAGLIPELKALGWHILEPFMPRVQPLYELKQAFANQFRRPSDIQQVHQFIDQGKLDKVVNMLPGSMRLLLVVDQFEEVFTVCGNEPEQEAERRKFIELLTQVKDGSRLAIVATMRADFMEPCYNYGTLTQRLKNDNVPIPPVDPELLREVICQPAQLQGYQLEPGLLELMLRDTAQEANCLPLVQFTLQKLWDFATQSKHCLRIQDYEQVGGVIGALNSHAQQYYESLSPLEQEWVKRICLKLVRTVRGVKEARQRQPKQALLDLVTTSGEELIVETILNELVHERLLVAGEEDRIAWIDLAHEALMENWRYFARWRQETRDLRQVADRIEDAYQEWLKYPQDSNLLTGIILIQARVIWLELAPFLTVGARAFFEQSDDHAILTQSLKEERRQMEREREMLLQLKQQARQEAEAANRIRDEFLAVLSHELRTPMNPILGWTKLLKVKVREFSEEQTQRALDAIERNAILQVQLIEDLLDVSRVLQGRFNLTVDLVNLELTITDAINTIRLSAEAKSINLSFESSSSNQVISGDRTRLTQVFWNLLSNAVKFTPQGGQISVELTHSDDIAVVKVTDSGIGIQQELLTKIFERFVQGNSNTTRQFGGLGLGLSLAKYIVELHRGTIQAESPGEGQGATFTVKLPLAKE